MSSSRRLRIAFLGTPVSSANRGVLALASSLVGLCCREANHVDISFLVGERVKRSTSIRVGDEIRCIPVVNYRLSPSSRPTDHLLWIVFASLVYRALPFQAIRKAIIKSSKWVSTVVDADVIGDIRGGDSFSDTYGLSRFLVGFLEVWSVILVKGSIVLLPQTYGPYKGTLARWLAGYVLNHASVIMARDMESRDTARRLVKERVEILFSPDVAFCLEATKPVHVQVYPSHADEACTERRIIGVNVSGLLFNGGYTRNNMFRLKLNYTSFLQKLIRALLEEHEGELWLVPHTYGREGSVESDPDACLELYKSLAEPVRSRTRIVTGDYDQHELKGIIGQCTFFVGSRMHACIAALSQGIPTVAVAYSKKFAGVYQCVGMADWVIDGRYVREDEAVSHALKVYRLREDVRSRLRVAADEARHQVRSVFQDLVAKAGGRDG